MKRITAILQESDAMAARKAACVAGGECIVITPIPYRMCGIDRMDIYSEKRMAAPGKHVRLEVTIADSRFGNIISAIRRIADAGRIALASRHDRLPRSQ